MKPDVEYLKSAFPDPLRLEAAPPWMPERNCQFRYVSQFSWLSPRYGKIVIPEDRWTDFASIPSFLQAFTCSDDDYRIAYASAIHDRLYELMGRLESGIVLTRLDVDNVMMEIMEKCGASSCLRSKVFAGVRMGGGPVWNRHLKDSQ